MEGDRISYHESVRRVYQRIKEDGMDNIWDRFEAQGMVGNPDVKLLTQDCKGVTGKSLIGYLR